jgi:hypothetical protein
VSVAASITAAAMAGAGTAAGASAAGAAGIFIMSTSKIVTGITAVVVLVAIGSAIYQSKAAREAAATVASVTAERDALRVRMTELEKRAQQSDTSLAATQNELHAAPKPAEASAPNPGASPNPALDYVLDHPETHAAFIEQGVLRVKARYDGFFKTAGLSPEQQERVLNAFKEARAVQLDILGALHAQGYDRGNTGNSEILAKSAWEAMQRRQDEIRAALGDEGFKAFNQFANTISARNVAEQMAGRLYNTNEPLTAQQADRLVEILGQNRLNLKAGSAPGNTVNGTVITQQLHADRLTQALQQGGASPLDWQLPVTDAAIARAHSVLTPTQLAALKQVQAEQAVQFQLAPLSQGGVNVNVVRALLLAQ